LSDLKGIPVTEVTGNLDASAMGELLARDVAFGDIQLPGFPPVVLRIQQLLTDERADVHDIVQAVSVDPALTMLVLRMANSSAFNTAGVQVKDLRAAIQRIGTRMIRAAALGLVVQALRSAEEMRNVRDRLGSVWRRGISVGSLGKAIAGHTGAAAADAGLLTGLLHVVGRLYVLARMRSMPHLLDQDGVPEKLMERWSGTLTGVLLLKWEVPREFYDAIEHFHEHGDIPAAGRAGLGEILSAAHLLADLLPPSRADYLDQMQLAQVCQQHEPLFARLGLSREGCSDAIHIALAEVQQLRALFGA
jgi:HD-like signal output (HDOD) protein